MADYLEVKSEETHRCKPILYGEEPLDRSVTSVESTNSDCEFTAHEIEERSNLFQHEFNQEELHDRVLVVQVMPDDYELEEWREHLEDYKNDNETEKSREVDCVVEEREQCLQCPENYFSETPCPRSEFYECGFKQRCDAETLSEFTGEALVEVSESRVVQDLKESESGSVVHTSSARREADESETDDLVATCEESVLCCSQSDPVITEESENLEVESKVGVEYFDGSVSHIDTPFRGNFEEVSSSELTKRRGDETGSGDGKSPGNHVIRERKFYVHGNWLAVNSHYFRSLLYASGMKESSSKEFIMKVTESEEAAFVLFLESIYNPAAINDADASTLLNVLRLSVKYDVKFSFVKSKRVLQATPLTIEVCETIIDAISSGGMSDMDDVMESVKDHLFREFTPLDETWESDKFASLSRGALSVLLASDVLVVQSENTVFVALMRWIAKHSEVYGNLAECSDVLSLVRFGLIKPTYLHDVVRVHEVAKQLENFDEIYLAAITHHALPKKRRRMPKQRRWASEAKTPTFMWILEPDKEMFDFDCSTNSRPKSSSFWYWGYKMHLRLDMSQRRKEIRLMLVVENMAEDGVVILAYNVDVKFADALHKSYTVAPWEYRGLQPSRGQNPFHKNYSLEEIKEILLGGSVEVTIIFEISVEKLIDE